MDVDRAVERFERLAGDGIHQLFTRQNPAGALRHRYQQVELIRSQRAFPAVEPDGARVQIDLEPAEAEQARRARRQGLAAQYRAQTRQQFARLEWLAEIVIRAQFQADHAVHRIAFRRQHHDRNRAGRSRLRANPPAHIESIRIRQHQIEQYHGKRVRRWRQQLRDAVVRSLGVAHLESILLKIGGDHAGQAQVVLDHQQALQHAPA